MIRRLHFVPTSGIATTIRRATYLPTFLAGLVAMSTPAPGAAQDVPYSLDGLVVTASPTPRPLGRVATHVTVLDGDELRAAGRTLVSEALRDVPGLAVVQGGSFGATTSLFLRGGESNYVLVLVDGVQVNQPGGSFDLAGLTLENVERIEVVRGGASALYGSDAVAGVVHVITRSGRGPTRASLTARAGSYGRLDWAADVRGGGERAAYSFSLARNETDGILEFNNRFTNTVLGGAVTLTPDDDTRGRLSVRLGDRRYHYPTDGSGNVVDTNAFTYADETTLGLELSRRLSDAVSVTARLAHAENDGGTDDAADGPADTLGFFGFTSLDHVRRSSVELRTDVTVPVGTVSLGAEAEDQTQRSFTESLSQFGTSAGRSEYDRWNRAAYAHLTGAVGAAGFNAGARLEDNERFGSSVTWQFGATLRAAEALHLRAATGRAIKEPTFFEHYATGFAVGNPELEPEEARSWEVGADVTLPGGVGLVRVTWFDQSFRDLIQYAGVAPEPGGPNFYNVAEAAARGLELGAEATVVGTGVAVAWSWLDSEVVDPGLDDGEGAEFAPGEGLLRRPDHTVSARLSRRLAEGSTVSLGVRRVGERDDRDFGTFPASRVTLAAYTDLFAGAEVAVGSGLTLVARGENLLDRSWQEAFGFRAPGRTLHVGARMAVGGR